MASKSSKPGTIDLPSLFESIAQALDLSVKQGRLLHKTKNIREAGAPFELEFRRFLSDRLAAPFRVATGYLFDPASVCTPQIDAIIVDERGAHEMMRTPEGASYVPYPCGRVLFEIKNTARGLRGHVKQVSEIGDALDAMRALAVERQLAPDRSIPGPLTVLVIGDSSGSRLATFQRLYTSQLRHPQLTWLADRGLIIARRGNDLSEFIRFENSEPVALSFDYTGSGGDWAIWRTKELESKCGRSLLWLYFAMIARLNATSTSKGFIQEFTDQIARDYPMILKSELRTATNW